ncbi:MAG TPA: hypothetical protein VN577_21120 [Terriglobales bacterium]|nr:hypothetical protein [Terriglobales bacterium]
MKRVLMIAAVLAFSLVSGAQQKSYSDVSIKVLKQETGRPVRNASVVLHTVNEEGKQDKGGLNLKTDADGKTSYGGVPYGKLRIQVIARGLQTYGEDFEINSPDQEIVIKLKPPQSQYSIYENKQTSSSEPAKK